MNALLNKIRSSVPEQNPFEGGADWLGGPQGAPYFSGQALRAKMGQKAPGGGFSGRIFSVIHNPGKRAMEYALRMTGGWPDAVAVTASNMPWMAHYRDSESAGGYPAMPEMQHTALGVLKPYYKMYNQIGGAGAYGGKAGASFEPTSESTVDSQKRQQMIDSLTKPGEGFGEKGNREYQTVLMGSRDPRVFQMAMDNIRVFGPPREPQDY